MKVLTWKLFMFVIFVASLKVPVNHTKGFTKTHKFATKRGMLYVTPLKSYIS